MYCPFCANDDTRVVDSRVVEEGAAVRRRRECEACGKRFSTYERAELRLPLVVKKDGTRQSFDLEKIRSGMLKALEKRPVSVVQIEQGLNALVRAVQETGEAEIAADVLGEFVM